MALIRRISAFLFPGLAQKLMNRHDRDTAIQLPT